MARAEAAPAFESGGAPVSFLVDYDGTISRVDITDELLTRFATDPQLAQKDADYAQGRIGSRELQGWDLAVLPRDPRLLRATADSLPQDAAFPAFVRVVREYGGAIEVVSDGLGFYVEPGLERLGVAGLRVATNETDLDAEPPVIRFPYGHPRCFVCGTCKRERVRLHQCARRAVVFVGDGTSDRFAAAHADVVLAKERLAQICRDEGWAYHPWQTFADVAAWTEAAFRDGRLPASAERFDEWRGAHAPAPRPFICGPEVWGEGRTVPGPGPR